MLLFNLFRGKGRDRACARALGRIVPGLRLLALPGGGHPATNVIVEAEKFRAFQQATFGAQIDLQASRAVHRASGVGSERYGKMVARYIDARMQRG